MVKIALSLLLGNVDDDDDDDQCYQWSKTAGALLPWRAFHLFGKISLSGRKEN